MHSHIKNFSGIAGSVAILVVAFSAYAYVQLYGKSVEVKSFTVSAEGKAVVLPDVAKFSFGVVTEGGKNLAELQSQNSKKVNSAIDFVIANHVDKKDIKTTGYNVSPRYENTLCSPVAIDARVCPPPAIVGYTISQDVQVKARDFSVVGDILSGVVNRGANSVSQLSFVVDDETKYKEQARTEAIEKAKRQAVDIAKAGGFQLGRVVSFQEGGGTQPYYGAYENYSLGASKSVGGEAPRIEAGSNEIRVSISITYEIE
ncbi:MAG: SIMPL domain-containing protein [Parcubacteria group bacterium]|nr:SIMPL domain-containing protein [Parcubacteria group bacterium]